MWHYDAPLRHMRFVVERVLGCPADWSRLAAFDGLDADTAAEVLQQAARFASEVLQPTNAGGDREGCTLKDGNVTTPTGYREAWRAFVDGGWPALACEPEVGGQGLPQVLNAALYEMLAACNHGWTMYPGLLHGAYETLKSHGSEALKAGYLQQIVSGEWLAAMALTEPQAGSDLGLVRTRAEPQPDGSLRVRGEKIFISGGDHDLTDNIVHLVLCRLPDAPAGTKGLSLALVPKVLPDGTRNAMACTGLEHKMGIHGSATCAMHYDGATGWLIGQPHRGLAAMFLMMNAARLHVGLQGLGHLEMAQQNARRYALERLQMRAAVRPAGAAGAAGAADPIACHPAMRRTLLGLQATSEGLRVVAYRCAQLLDIAEHDPDAAARQAASTQAALLTPVVKAFATHQGFHGASAALQVWGGYGYTAEFGIEQTVRDARIALIYEGTNEIQAIDLLQRKVLADGGAALDVLLSFCHDEAQACAKSRPLAAFAHALHHQVAQARLASAAIRAATQATPPDPEAALRVADDYLMGFGHLLLAWAWAASARAATAADDNFSARRLEIARHGIDAVLPQAEVHWARAAHPGVTLAAVLAED